MLEKRHPPQEQSQPKRCAGCAERDRVLDEVGKYLDSADSFGDELDPDDLISIMLTRPQKGGASTTDRGLAENILHVFRGPGITPDEMLTSIRGLVSAHVKGRS